MKIQPEEVLNVMQQLSLYMYNDADDDDDDTLADFQCWCG